jgi:hypothetical protein
MQAPWGFRGADRLTSHLAASWFASRKCRLLAKTRTPILLSKDIFFSFSNRELHCFELALCIAREGWLNVEATRQNESVLLN